MTHSVSFSGSTSLRPIESSSKPRTIPTEEGLSREAALSYELNRATYGIFDPQLLTLIGQYAGPLDEKDNLCIDVDKEAPRFFFSAGEQQAVENIRRLIDTDVHEYMTTDFICSPRYIREKGFKLLANKVLEHPELNGWLMKGGGQHKEAMVWTKVGKSTSNMYDNIMRVFMAERLSKVIKEDQLDIVIPEKRLLPSNKEETAAGLHKKYYVFSKKLDVLSGSQTTDTLRKMPEDPQRKVARGICQLIKRTGLMDNHFGNIRWSTTLKKTVILDTEPIGLLIATTDSSSKITNTVEKCALIGLHHFKYTLNQLPSDENLPIFIKEVDRAINEMNCIVVE